MTRPVGAITWPSSLGTSTDPARTRDKPKSNDPVRIEFSLPIRNGKFSEKHIDEWVQRVVKHPMLVRGAGTIDGLPLPGPGDRVIRIEVSCQLSIPQGLYSTEHISDLLTYKLCVTEAMDKKNPLLYRDVHIIDGSASWDIEAVGIIHQPGGPKP